MEMGELLQQVPGGPWVLVKERVLGRGHVYRSLDDARILRIGPRRPTMAEGRQTAWLHSEGFPVPDVLCIGQHGEVGYWVESSSGQELLGERFRMQFQQTRSVQDADVDILRKIIVQWLDAQLSLGKHLPQRDGLYAGLNIANVLSENPDISPSLVRSALRQARKALSPYPSAPTHGDANAFNMLDGGIIDLEHLFWGPAGYDSLNAIDFTEFFAVESPVRSHLAFRFTDVQRNRCLAALDEVALAHGVPAISEHFNDFFILKVLWSLSHMREIIPVRPDGEYLWLWRRGVARHALDRYLAHEDIDPRTFARIAPLMLQEPEGKPDVQTFVQP